MSTITIKAQTPSSFGDQFSAYHAAPAATQTTAPATAPATAPVIIVIQEIFGINAGLRQMCDQWAALGYHALAPDLFWRQEPNVELSDQTEAEWQKAFGFFNGFDLALGMEDLAATLSYARTMPGSNGKVGSVGFCLGGKLAYLMATRTSCDANVSYYGVGIQDLLPEAAHIQKPTLLHIAGLDKYVPPEAQTAITTALQNHPNATCYHYAEADHAFARINGIHFNATAAQTANKRTEDFFSTHLKGIKQAAA